MKNNTLANRRKIRGDHFLKYGELIRQSIQSAAQSSPYRHYLYIRKRVLEMMDEMQSHAENLPSDYWKEELSGMDYMFDASPLIIERLREHCYHLTGIRAYDYRQHHIHRKKIFAQKLKMLQQQDNAGLLSPENPTLGGFGYSINDSLYNLDTLKYYECLIALNKAGILDSIPTQLHKKSIVMEIGAGWGGFAYQFKTHFPNTTYIIIDLPPTLLFSAVYIKTLFPSAKVFVYGDEPLTALFDNLVVYDFVFLPHYLINELQIENINLIINLVSFQEMTSEQVEAYVKRAAKLKCQHLYSLNRNRSRHNPQLTTVRSIIDKYYESLEIRVLDMAYVDLPKYAPKNSSVIARVGSRLKSLVKKRTGRHSDYRYRHIVGTLK
ncbi:MAG: putative sugar O-methyltransferase [Gammaproteobacteria bacterium]